MSIIHTSQDITVDFALINSGITIEFSESTAAFIEEQILDALDACNYAQDTDIEDMEYFEGGILSNLRDNGGYISTDDYFHMTIACDIAIDSRDIENSNGIEIDINRFIEELKDLDIIGEYIDTSSVQVDISDYNDEYEIEGYEPDWDSMQGGPDYYED